MKIYVNKLLLVFTFYVLYNTCYAQKALYFSKNQPFKFSRALSDIRQIDCLIKDSRGYVWFAAQGGLYRYDGYQTKWYSTDEARPNSKSSNPVKAIAEDKYGNIWIAVEGIGLKKLDPKTETFTHVPLEIARDSKEYRQEIPEEEQGISDIVASGDNLWLRSDFSQFRYAISTNKFYRALRIVRCTDLNDNLWGIHGGSQGFKIYKYNEQLDSLILKATFDTQVESYRVLLATKEHIYITFDEKVLVYNITTNKCLFLKDFENKYTYNMYLNADNNILIHQDSTLLSFDPTTFTAKPILNNLTLINYDIYPLSKNQILMSSENRTRLLNISPPVIESYNLTDVFNPFSFYNNPIYAYDAHKMTINYTHIVDFEKAKLLQLGAVNPALNPSNKYNQSPVRYVNQYTDTDGTQWFAYFEEEVYGYKVNFYAYSPKSKSLEAVGSFQDETLYSGYPATGFVKLGDKFYISNYEGLFSYDIKTKKWEPIITLAANDSVTNHINQLYVDNDGDLWISTQNKGVIVKKKNQNGFKYYSINTNNKKDWAADWASDIVQDKKGTIWIATSKGLFSFDKKTETFKKQDLNLPDNFINNIVLDDAQTLWLSHDKGITHFDPNKKTLRHYNDAEGILDELIEDGIKLNDGSLVFNATGRLYHINPKNIAVDSTPIPIYLTDIQLFNKPIEINGADSLLKQHISFAKSITFKYNQNIISLYYTAIDFVDADNRQYAYFLEGLDNDWQYVGQKREAVYSNLPPGKYTFRVKSANRDGVWLEMATPLSITVLPPWWKTWWAYLLYAFSAIGSIWAFMNYRARNLRRQNKLLEDCVEERTSTVVAQKEELNTTLNELKATQTQLIQSEKLASLGELTAGIAHEIQNPLNFVNNFSELSVDLANELEDEIKKPEFDKDLIVDLTKDIKSNQEKINHHGKRASSIVKGMLEHSRSSTGVKDLTDINKLADEYLRLSYHGLRAKDKSFNADFKTDFQENLPKINIIPQDIGRVLLNLINNAFYAVNQRKQLSNDESYTPSVSVTTQQLDNQIIIKVKDNGTGMPESVRTKVFQPFFTTKPTGQGTGLGLSLAYDIVTKGHGGTLDVESTEGVGTEFTITLLLKD
jgi:signal transduction histidine kinase/streptogramin lyase